MDVNGRLQGYEFPPTESIGFGVTIASGVEVSVANTTGISVAVGVDVDVSVGGMLVSVGSAANVAALIVNVAVMAVF